MSSWWYVQHMLPYGTDIRLYAFIVLQTFIYSFFYLRLFLSTFFFFFFKSGIEMPDRNSQWYWHLPTLFAFFFNESNTEGTSFWIMFICFTFVKCACFVLYSTSVRFDLVKSPEVTLCG